MSKRHPENESEHGRSPSQWELIEAQNRELREVQRVLEETRERYADLYDYAPVGYITLDRLGQVLEINLTAAAMLGVEREHLLGQPLSPHIALGDSTAFFSHLRKTLDSDQITATELRLRKKDRTEFDALLESVSDRSGRSPESCRTMLLDISDRKRTENALAHSRAVLEDRARQLAHVNNELRSFSHMLSHDLKAPLRAMSNLATVVEEDYGQSLAPEARQYLHMLRDRARQADELINRVLAFSRADNPDAGTERIDVAALIKEVFAEMGDAAYGFRIEIGESVPTLEAERLPLRQTLVNLIGNTIQHHDRDSGRIRIDAREQGDFFEFTVTDDGPGIHQAQQEGIFDMFRSFDQGNGTSSGMGLGLVRKLVASRGGSIRVESDPEQRGTTFRFTWPRQPPPDADSTPAGGCC
ncbi:sensor histidine kinase [Thiohalomonas denitrificans]|uniref:histidine kinase n=1 Tax=Thiohalomonas denitrificans TaxID=415747 RepID=A0A1G5QKW7_9GAMM|nr:PAS domain-containing sensor histidine kinase [Thiohalomonas denitrificans]SCZ62200.1 PAS domain S-box-containing protein [Thiohalomonas denitrificans]